MLQVPELITPNGRLESQEPELDAWQWIVSVDINGAHMNVGGEISISFVSTVSMPIFWSTSFAKV